MKRAELAVLFQLAMTALIMSVVPALAESDAFCQPYASRAVAAHQQSQAANCGFSSPRWQPNRDNHYNWCRTAPAQWARAEEEGRANQLRVCRREPKAVECNNYAILATGDQQSNVSGRCGFTGARWGGNQDAHLAWCLQNSIETANREINVRQTLLGVCSRNDPRQNPVYGRCDDYARQAVSQANEAASRQCGFGGPRWTPSYEDHLTWCIGQPVEVANSEARQRAGPLSQCRTTNPVGGTAAPAAEACTWSSTIQNRSCLNVDGTPSSITPGSMSAAGCGGSQNTASARAKLNFATSHACLTEGNAPTPGCCTFTEQVSQGCLCR